VTDEELRHRFHDLTHRLDAIERVMLDVAMQNTKLRDMVLAGLEHVVGEERDLTARS